MWQNKVEGIPEIIWVKKKGKNEFSDNKRIWIDFLTISIDSNYNLSPKPFIFNVTNFKFLNYSLIFIFRLN